MVKKKWQEAGDPMTRMSVIKACPQGPSIRRQCELLAVNRSRLYYRPVGEKPENLKMMCIMDKHLLNHPTEGVRSMVNYFREKGNPVGPNRIRRLFRLMNHQTIYRRKNLTRQGMVQYVKPYLLRNLKITAANQVWSTDITYIPMKKGFMYLTAIIDVYSRRIVGWCLSNTLTAAWILEVLKEAIREHGRPAILNSDQGSQYTSAQWIQFLEEQGIQISMDGKGRATDNIWIERFWKTIKYDYVYLNPAEHGLALYEGIENYIEYYNQRIHQTTGKSPNKRYQEQEKKAA